MPAAYVTDKVQKFITPDGVEHETDGMKNKKFAIAILWEGYPEWYIPSNGYYTVAKNADISISQWKRNPAVADVKLIKRTSKVYKLTGTDKLR